MCHGRTPETISSKTHQINWILRCILSYYLVYLMCLTTDIFWHSSMTHVLLLRSRV
jgi:hypothetical protein